MRYKLGMADSGGTTAAVVEIKSLVPGDLVNERFQVLRELGGGGFATVYEVLRHRYPALLGTETLPVYERG